MSPSGRVEYLTLPLYHSITEEEASGKSLLKPKDTAAEAMLKKWAGSDYVDKKRDEKYIHAFTDYESALEYMSNHFKGYFYTRPVIYQCESDEVESVEENVARCNSLRFIEPVSQIVNFKVTEYLKLQRIEKKKTYGFSYDESEINGDVEQDDEN